MGAFLNGTQLDQEAPPVSPFADPQYAPLAPPDGLDFGEVIAQPPVSVGPTDVITFAVHGGDPWYGAPRATLIRPDGAIVTRPDGEPVDSDTYGFWVDLSVDPPYTSEDEMTSTVPRHYRWQFSVAARRTVPSSYQMEPGDYRLRVELPRASGEPLEIVSDTFSFDVD
jgi:hypothetical protein